MTFPALPYAWDIIASLLDYDPLTGSFTWKPRAAALFKDGQKSAAHECAIWNARYSGKPAGRISPSTGYLEISIFGRRIGAHRIAVLLMTKRWPSDLVDHINRQRSDNSWCNLREVTRSENAQNISAHADSTSRLLGVHRDVKRATWVASIRSRGQNKFLGRFETEHEASSAYQKAKAEFHLFEQEAGQ